MSGNTYSSYDTIPRKVGGFDSYPTIEDVRYINPKDEKGTPLKIGSYPILIPDNARFNNAGLGWSHTRILDPVFSSYTITTTTSSEYTFTLPRNLRRIKNLYMMYSLTAGSSTPACAIPFYYVNLQIGDQSLPQFRREHLIFVNTAFESNSEDFTHTGSIKGFSSALASDATSTTAETRVIDLSPLLPKDLHTLNTSTDVYIKYMIDTIANCVTSGGSISVTNIYFIFTEWLDSKETWNAFIAQNKLGVRQIPYLYPFRLDLGSVTDSTTTETKLTINQLQGRCCMFYVGLCDSGNTINQNSHIYDACTTGFLDANDVNIFTNWNMSEATSVLLAQKHGLSNDLFTYITHAHPYIFCKNIKKTIFEHINTGGFPMRISQQKIYILPSASATTAYTCHLVGFLYGVINMSDDGRMIGGLRIIDG